ncbi:hypothetical protein GCM10010400_41290 [Streptomyces aculeolatus]|uniref:acyl carrier protein n=1 Tax=Streptomyces aculeolatus TaxID=270689 RepID=UPI001CECA80C|nr:acyl carrier protein [Streptomyces aculeolatus]
MGFRRDHLAGDHPRLTVTDFQSLDLDSLVLIELAVILKKQYGVEVDGKELAAAGTAAKAAAPVSKKTAHS